MPDLTKRESAMFMLNMIIAMSVFWLILWGISEIQQQDNCWTKYNTEQAAIQHCENKP